MRSSRRCRWLGRSRGHALVAVLMAAHVAEAALPGELDPTFNGGQPVLLEISRSVPRATSFAGVAFDATGRLIVTGNTYDENGRVAVALVRLLPDGSLDGSFGSNGSRVEQLGFGTLRGSLGRAIGLRPGGAGWLVTGEASAADGRLAMLSAAFDATGALDLGYGSGGSVRSQPAGPPPQATFTNGGAVAADGSTFVAGTIEPEPMTGANRMFAVTKVTPAGLADGSFGNQGSKGVYVGSFSQVADTGSYGSEPLVTASGVLVAGTTLDAVGRQQFLLVRLTTFGTVDPSFAGGAGFVRAQVGDPNAESRDSQGMAIARGSNGEIYVAGSASDSDNRSALSVARFTAGGALDASFGNAGTRRVQTASADSNAFVQDVAVQPDGKVLLLGASGFGSNLFELVLLRLHTDGALDGTFGASGVVRIRPGDESTGGQVEISPDGQSATVTGSSFTGSIVSGLVARVLLAEVAPPTTTTTTLPGGCTAAPSIPGARCRLADLRAAVTNGVPTGKLQRRLLGALGRAADRLTAAETLDGRRQRAKVRKALAQVRRAARVIDSKLGRRTLLEDQRAALAADAGRVAIELESLL